MRSTGERWGMEYSFFWSVGRLVLATAFIQTTISIGRCLLDGWRHHYLQSTESLGSRRFGDGSFGIQLLFAAWTSASVMCITHVNRSYLVSTWIQATLVTVALVFSYTLTSRQDSSNRAVVRHAKRVLNSAAYDVFIMTMWKLYS